MRGRCRAPSVVALFAVVAITGFASGAMVGGATSPAAADVRASASTGGGGSAGGAVSNPPSNIAPCSSTWLAAINCARADEGIGPLPVKAARLAAMSVPDQLFTLTDYERTARGLPPFSAMTSRLAATAQIGADDGGDPPLHAVNAGSWAGGVWAGGLTSAPGAMYEWMYEDGPYTPVKGGNVGCMRAGDAECWGHRDNLLHAASGCSGGKAPSLTLGAATDRSVDGGSIAMTLLVSCSGTPGKVTYTWAEAQTQATGKQPAASSASPGKFVALASTPTAGGYWEVTAGGAVHAFGTATSHGTLSGKPLSQPIVGMASTPDGKGYWLVARNGGVFAFGDATFHGSVGHTLVEPIVGIAADPATGGYWLVAADGGIFAFDAAFHGSMGGHALAEPIVGMAAASGGRGYWLVARDGGIFTFGKAAFHGSMGARTLASPIVGMAADPVTGGYWMLASDGGIFAFDAPFHGSMSGHALAHPMDAIAALSSGGGYWVSATNGGIYTFGAARFFGSAA